MLYAVIAAIAWGAASGHFRSAYWVVGLGALIVGAMCLWLERAALIRSAPADRRMFYLLLAPAYAFVTLVALGLICLSYFLATLLPR
jgi:hypothetical protein